MEIVVVTPWYSSLRLPVQSWQSSRDKCCDGTERRKPAARLLDKGNEFGVRLRPPDELSRKKRTKGRNVVRQPAVMPMPASTLDQIESW